MRRKKNNGFYEKNTKSFWQHIINQFVQKERGKGLSTNDFTTEEKNKLASLKNTTIDTTLTVSNAAADAKAVGDALATKQPAGNYITTETDPTVPAWAKAATKPTYTASEVGADASGTASSAVSAHNTNTSAHGDIRARLLPSVTASDAGKFLCVNSSGSWAASALENAEEVSF